MPLAVRASLSRQRDRCHRTDHRRDLDAHGSRAQTRRARTRAGLGGGRDRGRRHRRPDAEPTLPRGHRRAPPCASRTCAARSPTWFGSATSPRPPRASWPAEYDRLVAARAAPGPRPGHAQPGPAPFAPPAAPDPGPRRGPPGPAERHAARLDVSTLPPAVAAAIPGAPPAAAQGAAPSGGDAGGPDHLRRSRGDRRRPVHRHPDVAGLRAGPGARRRPPRTSTCGASRGTAR